MTNSKKAIDLIFSPKYLPYTNVALGGTFLGLGDVIEQLLNQKFFNNSNEKAKDKLKIDNLKSEISIDLERVRAMAQTGLLFGAGGHYWYKFLDRKFPGTAHKTILKKLACEMAIAPPWFFMTFLTVGFFEKQDYRESIQKFKKSLPLLLVADYLCYIPLQSLNFKFIPPKFRFTYVACLTVVYDCFLAFVLHK